MNKRNPNWNIVFIRRFWLLMKKETIAFFSRSRLRKKIVRSICLAWQKESKPVPVNDTKGVVSSANNTSLRWASHTVILLPMLKIPSVRYRWQPTFFRWKQVVGMHKKKFHSLFQVFTWFCMAFLMSFNYFSF